MPITPVPSGRFSYEPRKGLTMRAVYRVLAYLLAVEVLVQGMAIAYGIAGLGKWVEDDGGVLNKQVLDANSPHFKGAGGFAIHGINGMMLIPILVLLLLITSFFAKVSGASKRAGILVGLVLLQVVLGIMSHSIPFAIVFHVLNAFAIFLMAAYTGYRTTHSTGPLGAVAAPVPVTA
ncbi:MAG: hypothetical protein JWO88_1923 [Frankiales bacterium]|nr:hypothetical protein [Frankiales bacterium]